MPPIDPTARVVVRIERLLAERPHTEAQLLDALLAEGVELGPEPRARLDDVLYSMPRVAVTCDLLGVVSDHGGGHDLSGNHDQHEDVFYDRLALLRGVRWTVPVSELDLASDSLPSGSLPVLAMPMFNDWVGLDGGGTVGIDWDERRREVAARLGVESSGGLVFPEGWLAGHGAVAGAALAFTFDGEVVTAEPLDEPATPSEELIDALDAVLAPPQTPAGQSRYFQDALWDLMVLHPHLLNEPFPPLADLFVASGLELHDGRLAPAGFDFASEARRGHLDEIADEHGLGARELAHFAAVDDAFTAFREGRPLDDADLVEAAAALGEAQLAMVVAAEFALPDDGPHDLELLARFGERLIEAGRGRQRAGAAWLVAETLAVQGEVERSDDWLDVALGFDDDHVLALYDKAWLAFDRGELSRARTLLTQVRLDFVAHDLELLADVSAAGRAMATVGRNEPCPCGSGRKFKQCHQGKQTIPLDARLTWLYRKANWWLGRRYRTEVEWYARRLAVALGISMREALEDHPLAADLALCEGGRWEEWLEERGRLLPDDEALLAAQWALIGRSVFEVTDVRRDEGMTVRDVRTGDVVDVDERLGTRGMRPGTYLLARPLPTGTGRYQFFGGILQVPDHSLQDAMAALDGDPSPSDVLGLVGRMSGPPGLQNTDGDDLVLCEITWRVDDPDAAAAALDERFEARGEVGRTGEGVGDPDDDDPELEWSWLRDPDAADAAARRTVLGRLVLRGDELVAEVNSVERSIAVRALVEGAVPDVELVEELRQDADDIRADAEYERALFGDDAGSSKRPGLDPANLPPEVLAAVRAQFDRYEESWVDESIPALGGLTPRQALDDPTRRDDLFRLLDQMEARNAASPAPDELGMRVWRLRELLGLLPD